MLIIIHIILFYACDAFNAFLCMAESRKIKAEHEAAQAASTFKHF